MRVVVVGVGEVVMVWVGVWMEEEETEEDRVVEEKVAWGEEEEEEEEEEGKEDGDEGGGQAETGDEDGPSSNADTRCKIERATEVCRQHDKRAQARPA